MVFSSGTFIFCFLPVCLVVYYLLGDRVKNSWLLFMSLLFYAWGGISFFPIICISILLNYFGGYAVDRLEAFGYPKLRKTAFVLTVCANLLLLGYWKYLNFFEDIVQNLLGVNLGIPEIVLPIGISFFTFQGLSYVIDVYRKKAPVQEKLIHVGLYIALFPQLIAGPIVRYSDINEEIRQRKHSPELFAEGIRRFTVGLAKKAILSNSLAVNADAIFNTPYTQNTPGVAWIGVLSYTLQIYFDFSGYSDMAIGLGRMLGFHIPENFNYPYISRSIAEFWRRWHISLGNWLRDYLYIPLGGNRRGRERTIVNRLIVFGICGLWHGASWTFVFWGGYYGVLTLISLLTRDFTARFNERHKWTGSRWFQLARVLRTNLLVMLGWVFFRSESMHGAVGYLGSMFGLTPLHQTGYTWKWYLTRYEVFLLAVALLAMLPVGKKLVERLRARMSEGACEILCNAGTLVLLAVSVMYVVTSTYNPFIYFQF